MVQAIVTILAVINPVVCGSIFLTLTPKLALAQRRWAPAKVTLSILIILVISALIELKVLRIFNISLDVFRIVGGMIIAYMGFDMLSGRHTVGQAPPPNDDGDAGGSLAPLIMFAAGPGTITAVVTLAAVHTPDSFPVTAIAAAVIGSQLCFLLLGGRVSAGALRPWSPASWGSSSLVEDCGGSFENGAHFVGIDDPRLKERFGFQTHQLRRPLVLGGEDQGCSAVTHAIQSRAISGFVPEIWTVRPA